MWGFSSVLWGALTTVLCVCVCALCFVFLVSPKLAVAVAETAYPSVWFRRRGRDAEGRVAMSIDDVSWMPVGQSRFQEILDVLAANGAKATFFVISAYVRATPGAEERLVGAIRAGHQVGNHGASDASALRMYSGGLLSTAGTLDGRRAWRDEIRDCEELIDELYERAGVRRPMPHLYRPGHGFFNQDMLAELESDTPLPGVRRKFKLVLGSVYPLDPGLRWRWFLRGYVYWHATHGDTIILHDRLATPDVLRILLPALAARGLKCVTVGELMT